MEISWRFITKIWMSVSEKNTMYTKRYIIDLKIKPYFEKKILSEITVADVRAWQNELLTYKDKNGKGYSPTYLKTVNCQLTAIFNYAMRYYNLQDNPCRKAGAIGKVKENRRTSGCRKSSMLCLLVFSGEYGWSDYLLDSAI